MIGCSDQLAVKTAPATASVSAFLLKSMQAGPTPITEAQYRTIPPVVDPMVSGRQRIFPGIFFP